MINDDERRLSDADRYKEEEAKSDAGYRYYLEDHPYLGPLVTLILGGLCIYSTVFSNTLRDLLVGSSPTSDLAFNLNRATGWLLAFVVGIMVLSFIFLMLNVGQAVVSWARRRPAVCPNCGAAEQGRARTFKHEPIKFTEWESVTCSQCGHTWHGRR